MKPRRRWFRFSLRTFFVLLTVFGVWLGVQVKWKQDRERLLYDEIAVDGSWAARGYAPAPWSLRILGEEGVAFITIDFRHDPQRSRTLREKARRLFPEAEIFPTQPFWLQEQIPETGPDVTYSLE